MTISVQPSEASHSDRSRSAAVVLLNVQAGAMWIQNFHGPPPSAPPARDPRPGNSRKRAPRPKSALGAIRGAQESQVQLKHGLERTKTQPDLTAGDAPPHYLHSTNRFIPRGSVNPVAN